MDKGLLIDPSMRLTMKSKGLNKMVAYLSDGMKKPPRSDHKQNLRDTLRVTLLNLWDLPTNGSPLAYHRDHKASEYKRYQWFSNSYLNQVADYLEQIDLIKQKRGRFLPDNRGESLPSRMWPTFKLLKMFDEFGMNGSSVEVTPPVDIIRLRDVNGDSILVPERSMTKEMRDELSLLHRIYADTLLQHDGRAFCRKYPYRVFNNSMASGGRFYGDGIKPLNKKERRKLTINGERATEYDYQSIHPAILYALAGEKFRDDIYTLRGYPDSAADRKFIKMATLTLINSSGDQQKTALSLMKNMHKPGRSKKTGKLYTKLEKPAWLTDLKKFIAAVADKNKPITQFLKPGIGGHLQRLDSSLAGLIMTHFAKHRIPVFGVHDSFIAPDRYGNALEELMKDAFYSFFGTLCKVTREW